MDGAIGANVRDNRRTPTNPCEARHNAVARLGSIITPAAMGLAAEAWGIAMSFYVIGAVFMLITVGLAIAARRMR
jgi:hypothetical protein